MMLLNCVEDGKNVIQMERGEIGLQLQQQINTCRHNDISVFTDRMTRACNAFNEMQKAIHDRNTLMYMFTYTFEGRRGGGKKWN